MTGIGSQNVTAEQWYGGIIQELVSSLELKLNRRTWWRDHSDLAPVQRFSEFIEKVLLAECSQHVVIFIDEIDSVLRLNFKDDFFAVIRACYNKRADKPEYKRLTFALLGVATPSNLIQDKNRTPFNIGQAVELHGFQLHEAQPLAKGLSVKVSNPQAVLREVLTWTGGQPFLTQKLCKLVLTSPSFVPPTGDEAKWVEDLVRLQVIENWEATDDPEHLKTIRDRILRNEQRVVQLLGLYQQILQQGEVKAYSNSEQIELRLSGLVVEQQGKLRVYNRIYKSVFNQSWVDKTLASLRPYAEALEAWVASQDESRLLRGQALQDAHDWAAGKGLSDLDYHFLTASEELGKREALQAEGKAKEAERGIKQILTEAQKKAKRQIRIGSIILAMSLIGAVTAVGLASRALRIEQIDTLNSTSENLLASNQLLEALIASVKAGRQLQGIIVAPNQLLAATVDTLQQVVNTTQETNRLEGHGGEVYSVSFSPDGKMIATASEDKTVKLWSRDGKDLNQPLQGHRERVWSVRFSPYDQKTIGTTSWDETIKLWNWDGRKSQELTTLIGHQGWVFGVSFGPDRRTIASCGTDKMVRLWRWDVKEGSLQKSWYSGHKNKVVDVAFSPNGKIIATASDDGTTKLWNLNGTLHRTLEGHSEQVMSASFSPNGQTIATASFDKTVKLWNLNGALVTTLRGHSDWIWDVSFSPDGKTLASASRDKTVRLWRIDRAEPQGQPLNGLLVSGCGLLQDYLKNNPNVQESDRQICDGVKTSQ